MFIYAEMKGFVKDITPPIVFNQLKKFVPSAYGWKGNYSTWNEAKNEAEGYDKSVIVEKVTEAIEKVVAGEAVFERDSVLFHEPDYNWQLISALLYVAASNGGNLSLIDFGGSLGSSYFQNRPFLKNLNSLSWNIVEQQHFVDLGKQKFSKEGLQFHYSIGESLKTEKSKVLLLSSVLQYLEEPYRFLEEAIEQSFETIIIDRMPFNTSKEDRICVQHVNPDIYPATYPSWLLDKEKFNNFFQKKGFKIMTEFDALDGKSADYEYKGMIFEK